MRIYLDVSCYQRLSDDQRQARVRIEAEAVSLIIERIDRGDWTLVASDMIVIEIDAGTDDEKRRLARAMLPEARQIQPLTDPIWQRATECEAMGFKPADAVHIAAAEACRADVFLTCDDRLLRTAGRSRSRLHVRVDNPLSWLEEQLHDADA